jgi:hypothetical protein
MDDNRIHQMIHMMIAKESRENDMTEAFGQVWDEYVWQQNRFDVVDFYGIEHNSSLTVLFKPHSGNLNQNELLPLRYAPITIELELVDNKDEPIPSQFTRPGAGDGFNSQAGASITFRLSVTFASWTMRWITLMLSICSPAQAYQSFTAPSSLKCKPSLVKMPHSLPFCVPSLA